MHVVNNVLKKPLPIIAILIAIIGLSFSLTSEQQEPASDSTPELSDNKRDRLENDVEATKALSDIWQLDSTLTTSDEPISESPATGEQTPTGLSVSGVYNIIGKIQYQGDQLVLDDHARQLLERSFQHLGEQVSAAQIEDIQSILQHALPGSIGEQAAQVIGKYYAYQQAKWSLSEEDLSMEENIELREQHLGIKLNAKLYGDEQAFQRYLNAAALVKSDSALNQQEREGKLTQLKEDLNSGVFYVADSRPIELQDIGDLTSESPDLQEYLTNQALALSAAHRSLDPGSTDWQQRYQQYNEQRRWVMDAALTSDDKRKQLDQLYSEFFTPEERSKINDYIDTETPNVL